MCILLACKASRNSKVCTPWKQIPCFLAFMCVRVTQDYFILVCNIIFINIMSDDPELVTFTFSNAILLVYHNMPSTQRDCINS